MNPEEPYERWKKIRKHTRYDNRGHEPPNEVIKEARKLAREAIKSSQGSEGSVDCPACGGIARLWYGVTQGELSVCCVEHEECDFAYHWDRV